MTSARPEDSAHSKNLEICGQDAAYPGHGREMQRSVLGHSRTSGNWPSSAGVSPPLAYLSSSKIAYVRTPGQPTRGRGNPRSSRWP